MSKRFSFREKGCTTTYMNAVSKTKMIPEWIIRHLEAYGNCAGVKDIVRKLKKETFLEALRKEGFDCDVRIIKHEITTKEYPLKATYIVEVKDRFNILMKETNRRGNEDEEINYKTSENCM